MTRFDAALELNGKPEKNLTVSVIAAALASAQREIFDEKKGSQHVTEDPAARYFMALLSQRLHINAINEDATEYTEVGAAVDEGKQKAMPTDVASRRWNDAESAQQGAVNVGAMAGSISRYAKVMEEAGMDTHTDPALRQIAHQMDFLFGSGLGLQKHKDEALDRCRAVVTCQSAHKALLDLQGRPAPKA